MRVSFTSAFLRGLISFYNYTCSGLAQLSPPSLTSPIGSNYCLGPTYTDHETLNTSTSNLIIEYTDKQIMRFYLTFS